MGIITRAFLFIWLESNRPPPSTEGSSMNTETMQQDSWRAGLGANQSKALGLLGQGISSVMVASTLGVSEGLISQFLADARFAEEVTKLKLAQLQQQTDIDNKHMRIENRLLDKLDKVIPLMTKPMDILRGIQVINGTKRRGMADAPVGVHTSQIVNINLPGSMAAKFITNVNNQIVEIHDDQGARSLITATPAAVERMAGESASAREVESIGDSGTNRDPEITSIPGWQASTDIAGELNEASERIHQSGISETVSKGLRRSFEAKGAITSDDL